MFFGKNAGCDFVNKGCQGVTRREWCSRTEKVQCSFTFKAKAYCGNDNFADGCSYATAYSNGKCDNPDNAPSQNVQGETYDASSRCVVGNLIEKRFAAQSDNTLCMKYQCTTDGKIKFLPNLGGEILCSKEGERAQGTGTYSGSIRCPNPADFCQDFYPSCPNSCSSKGYCVRGKCECRAGFSGLDCSTVSGGGSTPSPNPTPNPTPSDPCASVNCGANGYCLSGKCNCYSGFSGPNCLPTPVDPCVK